MNNKNSNNRIIPVVLLAVFFGLFAGIAGELISRQYIFRDLNVLTFGNELNLSHSGLNNPYLVIKDAKNIIIEQEKKIEETIESSSQGIVGIFEKIPDRQVTTEEELINLNNYYQLNNQVGEGLILTTDGWIITNKFTPNLNSEIITSNYVAITKDKKIYEIEIVKNSFNNSFWFLKLKTENALSVKTLASEKEIQPGISVLALGWLGKSYFTSIAEKKETQNLIKSSDSFYQNIELVDSLENYFDTAFIFDLRGRVIGVYNESSNQIQSINNFQIFINNILKKDLDELPGLGVNYIDLGKLVINETDFKQGALIYPDINGIAVKEGSLAQELGLKSGDIITSLNNLSVKHPDSSLNYLIQRYSPGDRITLTYIRDGQKNSVTGELKGVIY